MSLSLSNLGLPGVGNDIYCGFPVRSEYLFLESSGSLIKDNSYNRSNGSFGSTAPTRNSIGLVFSGSQWAQMPNNFLTGCYTVCCVFKTANSAGARLLSGGTGSPGNFNLYIYSGTVAFSLAAQEVTALVTYNNTWVCLVGVLNASTDMRIYANGAKKATFSTTDTSIASSVSGTIYLGKDSGGNFLSGTVAYISTLPQALTDNQVILLTNNLQNRLKNRGISFPAI